MPNYDYSCPSCELRFEVVHGMNDKPRISCPKCLSPAIKEISLVGFVIHSNKARSRVLDHVKRTSEQRQDLTENFGVQNVAPVGRESFDQVYNDIKGRGSFVREQMHQKREENENARKKKSREWKQAALRRVPERSKVWKEKQAKENAAKQAIRL